MRLVFPPKSACQSVSTGASPFGPFRQSFTAAALPASVTSAGSSPGGVHANALWNTLLSGSEYERACHAPPFRTRIISSERGTGLPSLPFSNVDSASARPRGRSAGVAAGAFGLGAGAEVFGASECSPHASAPTSAAASQHPTPPARTRITCLLGPSGRGLADAARPRPLMAGPPGPNPPP